MMENYLKVSELTLKIKRLLENQQAFQNVRVLGEVSNLTRHSSGHVYFTLKDEEAQIACTMFATEYRGCKDKNFKAGDKVIVRAFVSVYPPQGKYQLLIQSLQLAGEGALHREFLLLKAELQEAGWFDRKRPLVPYPKTIALLTSPTGAVVMDILRTLAHRYPLVKVLLFPVQVQGAGSVESICKAFELVSRYPDVETIILARGGGSLEDLWSFNDRKVAEAIYHAPVPVISAIGHETDFTIADFVADLRAPTPTAAASLVATTTFPEMLTEVQSLKQQTIQAFRRIIQFHAQRLDDFKDKLNQNITYLIHKEKLTLKREKDALAYLLKRQLQAHRHLHQSLRQSFIQVFKQTVQQQAHSISQLKAELISLDTRTYLARGYARVYQGQNLLTRARALNPQETLTIYFTDGSIEAIPKLNETI